MEDEEYMAGALESVRGERLGSGLIRVKGAEMDGGERRLVEVASRPWAGRIEKIAGDQAVVAQA